MLVVEGSSGNTSAKTLQATGEVVNIAITGLRENSQYSYYVLAANQFGNSSSSPVEIGENRN